MMLAFFVHQAQELCCQLFQKARAKFHSRTSLWESIRSFFRSYLIESWDDLWLSYAIVSIEMELQEIKGFNNVKYLNGLLSNIKYDTSNFTKSKEFVDLANEITLKIIPLWKKPSIPLDSPSDKSHYIRDLIILKLMYDSL